MNCKHTPLHQRILSALLTFTVLLGVFTFALPSMLEATKIEVSAAENPEATDITLYSVDDF